MIKATKEEYLYRYELEHFDGRANLFLVKHLILGTTPQGVWMKISHNRKKWTGHKSRNRYAHVSEREALKHYIRRKTYRNHCITEEMDRNDQSIREAKYLLKKNDKQGEKPITKKGIRLNTLGRLRKADSSTTYR